MSYKRYLITVTDNLSATSMPFNEFVLYRKTHFPEEKQIVYLLFKTKADDSVQIPDDIKVYYIGKNRKQISETTKRLVNEANEHQIPVVFHIHEAKSVLLFNIATRFRYYDKIIYTLHSTYKNYPLHNKVFCACASLMVKDVVCVSKTSYKYYPWYLKALRRNHVQAVQNGVDIDRINDAVCNIKERRENKTFTLIYVARLIPLKRHKILIDALQYSQNTRLIFIGTGPLENELKKNAEEKGIDDRINFMGLLPRHKVFEILAKSDVYVSSSSYEGLPIGVLEAMGCGMPCLVSDIEQHREIKEVIPTLMLCNDNPKNWAEKINIIAHQKPEEINARGISNKEGVIKNFSLENMHNNYTNVYDSK